VIVPQDSIHLAEAIKAFESFLCLIQRHAELADVNDIHGQLDLQRDIGHFIEMGRNLQLLQCYFR
jgi:hypothetical protein